MYEPLARGRASWDSSSLNHMTQLWLSQRYMERGRSKGEGVLVLDTPPGLYRSFKRNLWERIDTCLSSISMMMGRVRCASTRSMSCSRRFFSTATCSSTSSQSNQHFSRTVKGGREWGSMGEEDSAAGRGESIG